MLATHTPPSAYTFPSLIKASVTTGDHRLGLIIHGQVLRRGFHDDGFIGCCLLKLYSELGRLLNARKVFDELGVQDSAPCNALLDAFMKNGEVESALSLFGGFADRDVVSWTTMINGFVKNGLGKEALWWFRKMMEEEGRRNDGSLKPNESTIVCGLSACANSKGSGDLGHGRAIHGYVVRHEFEATVILSTALVDMYGKCGHLKPARNVFNLVDKNRKICIWNAMISCLACNGEEREALEVFKRMTMVENFRPNGITFVAILTACARAKLVECGLKWFESMSGDFGVQPTMEHYGCVVHLLGRAGLMDEAIELIKKMPFEADASVLGALLGACKVHGDVHLANQVGNLLLELQPLHSGRYMVLSNIYAAAGMWVDATQLKQAMENKGIKKTMGYSLCANMTWHANSNDLINR